MTELVRLVLRDKERSRPRRGRLLVGFLARALVGLLLSHFSSAAQADLTRNAGTGASAGKLTARREASHWGYVDADGKSVIPAQFDSASEFSEGVAAVEVNKRFGYIA
ncbi:MAG TPA: WG repeat-containing protein, partial [Candidatus Acidoferrum sp.]